MSCPGPGQYTRTLPDEDGALGVGLLQFHIILLNEVSAMETTNFTYQFLSISKKETPVRISV